MSIDLNSLDCKTIRAIDKACRLLDHYGDDRPPIEQVKKLAQVIIDNPKKNVWVESCKDEFTGARFGKAKCRKGNCKKIGRSYYKNKFVNKIISYQYWAVWD